MATARLEQRLKFRERPNRSPLMFQTWVNLLFAHWEVSPEAIQRTLPAGLTVDLWEDRAHVGVVPFFMRGVRPCGVPPLPGISRCMELNIRTYVVDPAGNPGVWFYSLDCNGPFAVWFARAMLSLPYRHAKMRAHTSPDDAITYHSARRGACGTGEFSYTLEKEIGSASPGSFEFFLIERYLLFTQHAGKLFRAQVHHRPYPLCASSLQSTPSLVLSRMARSMINRPCTSSSAAAWM